MSVTAPIDPDVMHQSAAEASTLLKTLSHKDRLMILCQLQTGEKTVSDLIDILDLPQSPISQHLARMRNEGLVATRRDGKAIYYSLLCNNTAQVIELLYSMFCAE